MMIRPWTLFHPWTRCRFSTIELLLPRLLSRGDHQELDHLLKDILLILGNMD
jgi:hypothetical protein